MHRSVSGLPNFFVLRRFDRRSVQPERRQSSVQERDMHGGLMHLVEEK